MALAGADGSGGLAVAVNGKAVGTIRTVSTNALRYNTDKGMWREYAQTFDAALLKPGENEMTLTVPAGDLTSGVVYDYLRLELNENQNPPARPCRSSCDSALTCRWSGSHLSSVACCFSQRSAVRYSGQTPATSRQKRSEWFICRRCMSSCKIR